MAERETTTDPRTVPSLAELRERARHKCSQHEADHAYRLPCHYSQIENRDLNALLDIAEAAQAMHTAYIKGYAALHESIDLGDALLKVRA